MNVQLLIIDPQNDFCHKDGALFVVGGNDDMDRLASFIMAKKGKLDDIHATLDSHHLIDIAHPIFWMDSSGKNPAPFTIITPNDLSSGAWTTTNPQFRDRATEYVNSLTANARYPLCIWPPHCLIGSWGYSAYVPLYEALCEWEKDFAMVDYVTKGSNFWTEHYSAVQADVPDPEDPGTQLNQGLIKTLQEADMLLLAGEARSHCLANTVRDIANNFGEDNIKKMYLLEDCTSDVGDLPGQSMFKDMGDDFVLEMSSRGMNLTDTQSIL